MILGATAVAFAASNALALPTAVQSLPAALAAPANQPVSIQAQPVRTQGWLKIYSGITPHGTEAVQLRVVTDPTVGQRVTDGGGRSLYRFDKDTADPSKSTCAGDCAVTWPPLLVASGQALYVDGIDPAQAGFIERPDGTCQITVGGWPVYYFSKDQKAGDLLGQGVGGTWFAVAPTGQKAIAK
ncbi:hypothetical protein JK358_04645 [Nocardia sp. 2]|uniref:Lipoprotein n=1 Tax=Nocardia acididurans TaxID=2802282 RepID=A0ABS1M1I4_9NOCA|nr:hypothetical protein [Nocardia acididurans]MBL1073674.1 hypothetical protein [Nocardia acididurans]